MRLRRKYRVEACVPGAAPVVRGRYWTRWGADHAQRRMQALNNTPYRWQVVVEA